MEERDFSCTIWIFKLIGWTKDKRQEGEQSTVQKRKLNFRFHNPNTVEATADYILKIFMEVNMSKVEKAIREEVGGGGLGTDGQEKIC